MAQTVLVALVLVPLAVAVVGGLLALLAGPFLRPTLTALERARFERCLAHAARADVHLQARATDPALREFEAAFCLMTVRTDARLHEMITRHHADLLARILTVADELPRPRVRLLALAKVDRLLDRRAEMQRAYLQLRTRPVRDRRRLHLERELRANARDTRDALRELIADLQLLAARKVAHQ